MIHKVVMRLELVFDESVFKCDKDGKDFLYRWVELVDQLTSAVEVHGKIIEWSPNEKQKEVLAYAKCVGGVLTAETVTEKWRRELAEVKQKEEEKHE